MNKEITVSLPKNISAKELPLFKPFLTYQLSPQKVKTFNNVFVTNSGYCLNDQGLIKESHHDHPHQIADYHNEAAHYYYAVKDHPELLIELDDEQTYLLIHHPWYNYYHWLMESIFRAWMVRKKKDKMILLLPDYYQNSDFIMGTLEPFRFENIYYIPAYHSLMVRNLCLPQIKAKVDSYDYKMMAEVRQFYLDYVNRVKKLNIDKGERIYISRKKAQRKKVMNEDEIEPILLKHNFTLLNNEDYSFLEQIAIYANAKYLVSIHGSGLTNMLFMKTGSKLLEFHKEQTNEKDWHSKAFWYMAEALGFDYYQQICIPTDPEDDYFNANFIVDPELLDRNLALLFADE
ncbi:Protein of unknown function [Mucilaginibacter lappiensis]|uniref:Capsular polysaccharide biosynthesis protein n=1 Tax=Mucilaginibacter lappiensis TaxID=354630 RepID=A0ABR6PT19_9SPHI|nr:glycosyltransferase family 61 protein [Mucilaginibacter lappiensis]MBB6112884.1 capsular polysaccharide biosynthesis protein [Mucilaginibacter lappiensis]SIS08862.1 Protein of unknown function [Mucilaginibacter lappiensis]